MFNLQDEEEDILFTVLILLAFIFAFTLYVGSTLKGDRHQVKTLVSVQIQ